MKQVFDRDKKIDYRRIYRMLAPSYKKQGLLVPLALFLAVIVGALAIGEPFIWGRIVDLLITSVKEGTSIMEGFTSIQYYLAAWVALAIANVVFGAGHSYTVWYIGNKMLGLFNSELFKRMLRLDIHRFENERAGELLRKFDNTWEGIWNFNELSLSSALFPFLSSIFMFVAGFWIDRTLALVTLASLPITIFVGTFVFKKTRKAQDGVSKSWEEITGLVGDSILNIATVRTFLGERRALKTFKKMYDKAEANQTTVNKRWAFANAGYGGIRTLGRFFIFVVGSWFVFKGETSIGTLVMFLGFGNKIIHNIEHLVMMLPSFSRQLIHLDRAAQLWYEIPEIKDSENARNVGKLDGKVVFNNLHFSYKETDSIIKGIDLTINDGETVALVGESGAGKSTLTKLLVRFYDPKRGSITIDGIDLRDMKMDSLQENIGYVMQENLLFHESIMSNIKYANPNASEKEIIQASKRAQAHQFISELPKGYKTIVGERGVKLSGGQKQRIALARVFLADPPILVLDEATSALDSRTEHELQTALKEVMENRTTLVIAHRLSTVMNADNIVVMDDGKIVDQGSHEELIKRGGLYKQYWEIQAGGYV